FLSPREGAGGGYGGNAGARGQEEAQEPHGHVTGCRRLRRPTRPATPASRRSVLPVVAPACSPHPKLWARSEEALVYEHHVARLDETAEIGPTFDHLGAVAPGDLDIVGLGPIGEAAGHGDRREDCHAVGVAVLAG